MKGTVTYAAGVASGYLLAGVLIGHLLLLMFLSILMLGGSAVAIGAGKRFIRGELGTGR